MSINERILSRIAYLHSVEFFNQKQISDKLNISQKVFKLHFDEIKIRKNYININIETDVRYKTEQDLISKFNLKEALLVRDSNNLDTVSESIGIEASKFVRYAIRNIYRQNKKMGKNVETISIGHGRILKTLIDNIPENLKIPLTICALANDPFESLANDYLEYKDTRVRNLAIKLRAKYPQKNKDDETEVYDYSPVIPKNKIDLKNQLNKKISKSTLRKSKESDIVIFGVGGFIPGTIYYKVIEYYEKEDRTPYISLFKKEGCIGGLGGSIPIKRGGKRIESSFNDHFIGLDFANIEHIAGNSEKYSILVGHGIKRAKAIKETINNHIYANVLVSDLKTGKLLLKL